MKVGAPRAEATGRTGMTALRGRVLAALAPSA